MDFVYYNSNQKAELVEERRDFLLKKMNVLLQSEPELNAQMLRRLVNTLRGDESAKLSNIKPDELLSAAKKLGNDISKKFKKYDLANVLNPYTEHTPGELRAASFFWAMFSYGMHSLVMGPEPYPQFLIAMTSAIGTAGMFAFERIIRSVRGFNATQSELKTVRTALYSLDMTEIILERHQLADPLARFDEFILAQYQVCSDGSLPRLQLTPQGQVNQNEKLSELYSQILMSLER